MLTTSSNQSQAYFAEKIFLYEWIVCLREEFKRKGRKERRGREEKKRNLTPPLISILDPQFS
jgi:hypothetical protein